MAITTTQSPTNALPATQLALPKNATNFQRALNNKNAPPLPSNERPSSNMSRQKHDVISDRLKPIHSANDKNPPETDGLRPTRIKRQAPGGGAFDPKLEERLESLRESSPTDEREKFVRKLNSFSVMVSHPSENRAGGVIVENRSRTDNSHFINKYSPDRWVFEDNVRTPSEPYFAANVTRVQYQTAVDRGVIQMGQLPGQVVRNTVLNDDTNDVMRDAIVNGESPSELLRTFLERTPNGRSTSRILDEFGLNADGIRIVDGSVGLFDGEAEVNSMILDLHSNNRNELLAELEEKDITGLQLNPLLGMSYILDVSLAGESQPPSSYPRFESYPAIRRDPDDEGGAGAIGGSSGSGYYGYSVGSEQNQGNKPSTIGKGNQIPSHQNKPRNENDLLSDTLNKIPPPAPGTSNPGAFGLPGVSAGGIQNPPKPPWQSIDPLGSAAVDDILKPEFPTFAERYSTSSWSALGAKGLDLMNQRQTIVYPDGTSLRGGESANHPGYGVLRLVDQNGVDLWRYNAGSGEEHKATGFSPYVPVQQYSDNQIQSGEPLEYARSKFSPVDENNNGRTLGTFQQENKNWNSYSGFEGDISPAEWASRTYQNAHYLEFRDGYAVPIPGDSTDQWKWAGYQLDGSLAWADVYSS